MSETRTPVEVAAEVGPLAYTQAMTDPTVPHVWRHVVSTVFGSVDVDGLAAEIGRHWLMEPSGAYGGPRPVERSCNCGRVLAPQYFEWRHSQEMTQHEAEAVKAWLTGGAPIT